MKKSVMKKWVKALRSGEYLQTDGELTRENDCGEDEFCCLGVLTNLYVQENGVSKLPKYFWDYNEEEDGLLCKPVMEWAGMKSKDGTLPREILNMTNLASLNDKGNDFNFIADTIERLYEKI